MAIGPKIPTSKKSWGHLVGGFLFIAIAAWAGLTFLPMVYTKVKGLFTKSAA